MFLLGCNPPNRGRALYLANCTGCHNANPSEPGSIGPDLRSTPGSVIKAKVLMGVYPVGYTPKRQSHIMPKFPGAALDINEIVKFIRGEE